MEKLPRIESIPLKSVGKYLKIAPSRGVTLGEVTLGTSIKKLI